MLAGIVLFVVGSALVTVPPRRRAMCMPSHCQHPCVLSSCLLCPSTRCCHNTHTLEATSSYRLSILCCYISQMLKATSLHCLSTFCCYINLVFGATLLQQPHRPSDDLISRRVLSADLLGSSTVTSVSSSSLSSSPTLRTMATVPAITDVDFASQVSRLGSAR